MFRFLLRCANTLIDIIAFPPDNAHVVASHIPLASPLAILIASVPSNAVPGYMRRTAPPSSAK
jgi:hypothetical protein